LGVDPLRIDTRPDLHSPIAVLAFAGWNDAASAATNTARFLVRRLGARRFASIDPEAFYVFTDSRPTARITGSGERVIDWPANDFFFARNPTGPHDVVVAIGVEPNLRWRSFAEAHTNLLRDLGVEMVVSLGALLADVPHTRPPRVTGSANDPEVAERLNPTRSRYQGPTGIVGVIDNALNATSLPSMSLWANVPHYITTSQNPPATVALLERLEGLLGLSFDYTDLKLAGKRFVTEVNSALGNGDPKLLDYVRKLEEAIDSGVTGDEDDRESSALPAAEDVVLDIEAFLRSQRPDGE